jgi:hypothetical protein
LLSLVCWFDHNPKMNYDRLRHWLSRHSVLSSARESHAAPAVQLGTSVLIEGQILTQTQQASSAGLKSLLQADSSSFITAFQAGLIHTTAVKPSGQECCAKSPRRHHVDISAFETRPRQRVSVAGAQSDLIKQLAAVFEGITASSRASVSDSLSRGSSCDIDAAVMVSVPSSVPSSQLSKACSVKALLQTWESLTTQQASQLTCSSSSGCSSSSSGASGRAACLRHRGPAVGL